jgi:hypothetical protein
MTGKHACKVTLGVGGPLTLDCTACVFGVRTQPAAGSGGDAETLIKRIVAGDEDVAWAIFQYKQKLEVVHSGPGTADDLRKHLTQEGAFFGAARWAFLVWEHGGRQQRLTEAGLTCAHTGYLRTTVGAEQRNKFVLIRWVGERIGPMARARMLESEAQVKKIIKVRVDGAHYRG